MSVDPDTVIQLILVAVMTALRLRGVCCCKDWCCRNHGRHGSRRR
jgi:hypothetical protein